MPSDVERKLALIDLLSSHRGKTVEEIFSKLPSFYSSQNRERGSAKKMFERDKEDLAAMGFPLLPGADDEGRETYRLEPPEAALPEDFTLTGAEASVLRGILQDGVLRSQLPGPALHALVKLHGLYAPFDEKNRALTTEPSGEAALTSKILAAIHRCKTLDVDYPDHQGKPARRVFSPWRLIVKRGRPYLLAWCHRDNIPKMLSVARVSRVAASRSVFHDEPDGFDARRYTLGQDFLPDGSEGWRVRLKVSPDEAWRLEETARDAVVFRAPDGGYEALFGVSNPDRFFRYVLTFGRHAEIVSPPEAREAFRLFLRKAE